MKAHSSVERAGQIGGVTMRKVPTDSGYAITGDLLKKMVEEDKADGLIPCYVRKKHTCTKEISNRSRPGGVLQLRCAQVFFNPAHPVF